MNARLLLAIVLLASGCGASVQSWTREDWPQADQKQVKHLSLQVRGVGEPLRRMWTLLARRYVNQHRNFIIRPAELASDASLGTACAGKEGVLALEVSHLGRRSEIAVNLQAKIQRCRDGEPVWTGAVQGAWPSDEPTVAELRAHYVAELGQEIEAYVAPAFLALKALVATLPEPILTDDDQMEKIEIGD
ncbi:MAG: MXAN_6521/LA_1396 family lipoprotein [Deltaproteobacteria bacterium]|nr:MXAN_6521/LA_1396 family lipoprotein [Deltaproteobacteria bacterium]